jgi:hypothetical protein
VPQLRLLGVVTGEQAIMKELIAATILLAGILVASSSMAQAPHFSKHEPYAKARVFLLKHGWKPVHAPDPNFECPKGDSRCQGRAETVTCAGTGLAPCVFRWKRKAVVIDVLTAGELPPIVTGVRCKSGCR